MTLINRYPNSHYIKSIIISLNARYRRVEDRESFIQVMDEIIQQHPDTEASRVAERWRKYAQTAPDDEWDNELKSKKLRKMIDEHKKLLKKRGIE